VRRCLLEPKSVIYHYLVGVGVVVWVSVTVRSLIFFCLLGNSDSLILIIVIVLTIGSFR